MSLDFDHSLIEQIFAKSNNKYGNFLQYINTLPLSIQIVPTQIGSHIYRSRHSSQGLNFNSFDDFKYPPKSNGYSRVGTPGEVWFYASETSDTCLTEIIRELNNGNYLYGSNLKIAISRWQIREKLKLLVIPDFSLICDIAENLRLDYYYSQEEK